MCSLAFTALAVLVVLWYLGVRPKLTRFTKVMLLFGIGVFPIAAAMTGNYVGFEATKTRRFCGSCHVMKPYTLDSVDPLSTSLAARHARNAMFGKDNCYVCHADYGMFGTITTKIGGMRHVYEYVFHYRNMSLADARTAIHLRKPFQNATCMECHSTENPGWNAVKDHASLLDRVRSGEVSCASAGCHGPAHPFSKGEHPLQVGGVP
ncbi:MAG: NapC/NirT family cytochrome c [Acidobacteriota bacterium]